MINKKVCILTSVHIPFDTRIFHKQAKTLAKAGYDVTLIAQHDKDEIVEGIKIIAIPRPKNRIERVFGLTLRVLVLAIKQNADLYHFHDPELIPAGLALKLLDKKVIYDVHEDYGKSVQLSYYLPVYTRKITAKTVDIVERLSSIFFDNVITATDDIHKKFSSNKDALTIQNFPLLSKFAHIKINKSDNKGNFNLIYIGGLTQERGIIEIIQAMEHLDSHSNIKLILGGKFSPDSFEKKVNDLEAFKNVEYLGFINQDEAWLRMAQADVGIVCFYPEGNHINAMPNKLFEYMAAGLPIIASNFPLWKTIVEGNKCGVCVDPFKPDEIARGIEYLKEHTELREEMGKNGIKMVFEKYNWEKESIKLLQIYEKLLKRNN